MSVTNEHETDGDWLFVHCRYMLNQSDNMRWPAADSACIRVSKDLYTIWYSYDKILEAVHAAVDTLRTMTW